MTRSSGAEVSRRIDAIYDLLLQGVGRRGIAQYADQHSWEVSHRQLDTYTTRAKTLLAKASERERTVELGKTIEQLDMLFMKALAANDRAEARALLRDRTDLLGLAAPNRQELTGRDGGPLEMGIADHTKALLADLEEQAARASQDGEEVTMDATHLSLRERLAMLPAEQREQFIASLPAEVLAAARYDWLFFARPDQLEPAGDWRFWLMRSGRGAGKTRAGAEWVRAAIEAGSYGRLHIVGRTDADVRETMVEGPSGLLTVSPPGLRPLYRPRLRRLEYPNGARVFLFSAEEPDRLRGPQCEAAWCDELASWRYPEAFDNLKLGLRLGSDPRCVITSTPRPTKLMRELIADPTTVQTKASTYANRHNLAPAFLAQILAAYEGTRLGRQEIEGELLEDVPGALWSHTILDELRVKVAPTDLQRIVVAVDPAVSSGEDADETGIVIIGANEEKHLYVLADLSGHYAPTAWAHRVAEVFHRHHANLVVAEANQGGDLVRDMLRHTDARLPVRLVHAARGKYARAEPMAALYEQRRVHHVGCHPTLEDQMCAFVPDLDRRLVGSPDRVDALVWGLWALSGRGRQLPPVVIHSYV